MIAHGKTSRPSPRSPVFAFGLGRAIRAMRGIKVIAHPLPKIPDTGSRPLFRGKDGVALTERVLLPVEALARFKEHAGFPANAALIAVSPDGTRIFTAGPGIGATRLFVKIEGYDAEVYFADGAAL